MEKKMGKKRGKRKNIDHWPKSLLTIFYADYQRFPNKKEIEFINNELFVYKMLGKLYA